MPWRRLPLPGKPRIWQARCWHAPCAEKEKPCILSLWQFFRKERFISRRICGPSAQMGLFGSKKPKAQDAQSLFPQVGLQDIPPPPSGGGLGLAAQKPLPQEKPWGQALPP